MLNDFLTNSFFFKLNQINNDFTISKLCLDKIFFDIVSINIKTEIVNSYLPIAKQNKHNKTKSKNSIQYNLRSDCMTKRFKAHCHRFIIQKLNQLLRKNNSKNKIYLISRELSTNVKYSHNKLYLSKTLKDIILESMKFYKESKSYITSLALNELISIESGNKLLNMKMKLIYELYLSSIEYIKDNDKLKVKESKVYMDKYCKVTSSFIDDSNENNIFNYIN